MIDGPEKHGFGTATAETLRVAAPGQLSHAAVVNLLRSEFFAGVHAVRILNV
jgi:hypothetical protein